MTKDELIERLGKKARCVELPQNVLGAVKAVFYIPMFTEGSFENIRSTMAVNFLSDSDEKIGSAELNIRIFQASYIRLSKISMADRKFEVQEDCSYRWGKMTPDYVIFNENGVIEKTEMSEMLYALLLECYRLFGELVEGRECYEAVVNPSSYDWMVSRGHLTED